MYALFLILHSWLRWGALLAGLLAAITLVTSKPPRPGEASSSDRWNLFFLIALDLQLVLGLVLYFVASPYMASIRANFGESMRIAALRFWAVEHVTIMLVAVIALHMARVLARKSSNAGSRRRRLLIGVSIAVLAILGGTPWPGSRVSRPLFRVAVQP